MFFDAISRGESFDYEAFLADVRDRPLERNASRRLPAAQGSFQNPVYGEGQLIIILIVRPPNLQFRLSQFGHQ